ncbi:MAG: type II toxin-antitoxin system RelE/ParE family toxin [Candidatus Omnitrophica bacterium]|nr:type II toxin-antitoxin system RelE/ParE family toxin [Candidatus Omnitrophota bacterium]
MAVREAGVYRRISTAFADLEKDPYQGKALKGQLKGRYSYRVGSYRIIYAIHERILTVFIIDVGHRGDIYR